MGWVYHASPSVEAASAYVVILAVCLTLTLLMVITVILRLILRAQASRLGAADYVMIVTMVSWFTKVIALDANEHQGFSIIYNTLCIARASARTPSLRHCTDSRRKSIWPWSAA